MYMSPERFQGERYDYASDVWSMGVIALEALTGVHPYASKKTFLSLSLAICKDPPPPPPEGTPPEVAEVIGACLRKEPSGKEGRPKVRELMVSAWLQPHSAGSPEAATLAYLREIGLVAPAVA